MGNTKGVEQCFQEFFRTGRRTPSLILGRQQADPIPAPHGPLRLTFGEFLRGEYADAHYGLYLVRDGDGEVAYIGISSVGVDERWFGLGGHMSKRGDECLYANSRIGRIILDSLPDSMGWQIELWTIGDCVRAYSSHALRRTPGVAIDRMEMRDWEFIMIRVFRPYANTIYNSDGFDDSWIDA